MEIETKDITSNPLFFNPAQSLKWKKYMFYLIYHQILTYLQRCNSIVNTYRERSAMTEHELQLSTSSVSKKTIPHGGQRQWLKFIQRFKFSSTVVLIIIQYFQHLAAQLFVFISVSTSIRSAPIWNIMYVF
jgi:hypothetical protein